jgi:large subunit ribosomal protein L23
MGIFDKIIGKKSARGGSQPMAGAKKLDGKLKSEKPQKAKTMKTEKSAEKPKSKPAGKKMMKREENIAHRIVLEPIISEKSTTLGAENKYVFKVSQNSSKFQIKEAIEGYYGVGVIGVNTIKIHPKKRIQGRTVGYKKGYKKAIVTLRQGDTIGVTEGV